MNNESEDKAEETWRTDMPSHMVAMTKVEAFLLFLIGLIVGAVLMIFGGG